MSLQCSKMLSNSVRSCSSLCNWSTIYLQSDSKVTWSTWRSWSHLKASNRASASPSLVAASGMIEIVLARTKCPLWSRTQIPNHVEECWGLKAASTLNFKVPSRGFVQALTWPCNRGACYVVSPCLAKVQASNVEWPLNNISADVSSFPSQSLPLRLVHKLLRVMPKTFCRFKSNILSTWKSRSRKLSCIASRVSKRSHKCVSLQQAWARAHVRKVCQQVSRLFSQ